MVAGVESCGRMDDLKEMIMIETQTVGSSVQEAEEEYTANAEPRTQFAYGVALVQSQQNNQVTKGLALLRGMLSDSLLQFVRFLYMVLFVDRPSRNR